MRLRYKNPTPYEWTYSELILSPTGVRFILNLTFCPIEPGEITIQANEKELQGYLFEGGEKILFNREDAEWVIEQLLEDKCVELSVDRYKTSLSPDGFRPIWSKAKHLLHTKKIELPLN